MNVLWALSLYSFEGIKSTFWTDWLWSVSNFKNNERFELKVGGILPGSVESLSLK